MRLPGLKIKNFDLKNCIFQGGMGVGISLYPLAGSVAKEGGLGIISSAGLDTVVSSRDRKKLDTYNAVRTEIELAKNSAGNSGAIGINVMCALIGSYENTIRGAIDAGADAIISGAGFPLGLPSITPPKHTALIPIVSSARALKIIVERWERFHYRPDAVVLEGPLAGGHLGFKMNEVENAEFALELLLPPVLDVTHKHGDFPVIVAGGIYTHEDILKFLAIGAKGVQIATRFLATYESSATDAYKQAVISAGMDDIIVVAYPDSVPASPCMLPFRILKHSPMYTHARKPKCNRGYLLRRGTDGKLSVCQAMPGHPKNNSFLCLCNGLISSAGYAPEEFPLYTVGANAYRVDRILSVKELMDELTNRCF